MKKKMKTPTKGKASKKVAPAKAVKAKRGRPAKMAY